MIRNLNIGKQLTRLQIRNAQPSKFRKWSNEFNSSARPAIVPCGFISCTQISNERGRRCTQLLGAFNTWANYRCASHWPTRKCRNFNQYPKPQQSQPLSLQLMDRPRLCSTAPQTVGGHFRMPQHVELVRHFLKLIFSQRTVHTAHGTRDSLSLLAGGDYSNDWKLSCPCIHFWPSVGYCHLAVQVQCANNKLHLSSAA